MFGVFSVVYKQKTVVFLSLNTMSTIKQGKNSFFINFCAIPLVEKVQSTGYVGVSKLLQLTHDIFLNFWILLVGGYTLGPLIIEGKTKQVYELPGAPDLCLLLNKDRITAGDGVKAHDLAGKAAISNKTNAKVFEILNSVGKSSIKRFVLVPLASFRCEDVVRQVGGRCGFRVEALRHDPHRVGYAEIGDRLVFAKTPGSSGRLSLLPAQARDILQRWRQPRPPVVRRADYLGEVQGQWIGDWWVVIGLVYLWKCMGALRKFTGLFQHRLFGNCLIGRWIVEGFRR